MKKQKKVKNKFNIGDMLYIPVEIMGIYKNEPMDRIEYRIRTVNMNNDIALKIIDREKLLEYRNCYMKRPDGEPMTYTNVISENDLVKLKEDEDESI